MGAGTAAVDRGRVEALFEAALDRSAEWRGPGRDWRAWLAAECPDPAVRAEVAALLAAHERAGGVLDGPAGPALAAVTGAHTIPRGLHGAADEPADVGSLVGPYRLVRELGRGGMGAVYLAERADDTFVHTVAIKILRRGLDTEDVVRRFLVERQILATLQHPHIARLLDGGVTADGRPYYVMEYVDGEPIDLYCDRRRLPVAARLRLFVDVARAVQYAHRSLVVHRDLKPSNVLVTRHGEVKLLDFGIAKLLDPDAAPLSVPLTRSGLRLMTPEYASPEQVRGGAITTATDVYGLGLLLYELLTGRRAHRPADRSLRAIERSVCEAEPPRPSVTVAHGAEVLVGGEPHRLTAEEIAAARGTTPSRLRAALAGDVDRIVAFALRKEPDRRYASAEALAADVERFLDARPVAARGDSLAYRAAKFVGRHRVGVAAAAAFVLLLGGYAVTATLQARKVERALAVALHEAEKAEQMSGFVLGVFEAGAEATARRDTLTVGGLLRTAAVRAERLGALPAVQAQRFDVIGRAYQRLGDYAAAEPFLERALALRRRTFGPRHAETAESMYNLAALRAARGRYAPAESLYREALALQRALLAPPHPRLARTQAALGRVVQDRGDYTEAERHTREALAMRRALHGDQHPELAESLENLAFHLQLQGRYAEAEPLFREVLAMRRRLYGNEHPDVAAALNGLGLLLVQRGTPAEAEPLYREALAMRRRLLGAEHPHVSRSLGVLASMLRRTERLEEAESAYREAIAIGRVAFGEEHPELAYTLNGLALTLRDQGRLDDADTLFRRVLAIRRKVLSPRHPALSTSLQTLGEFQARRGRRDEAAALLREAYAIRRAVLGEQHPMTEESRASLAALGASATAPAPRARVGLVK